MCFVFSPALRAEKVETIEEVEIYTMRRKGCVIPTSEGQPHPTAAETPRDKTNV